MVSGIGIAAGQVNAGGEGICVEHAMNRLILINRNRTVV